MPRSQRRGSPKRIPARAKSRRAGAWAALWIFAFVLLLGWFGTPAQRRPSLEDLRPEWMAAMGDWSLDAFPASTPSADPPVELSEQAWIDPAGLEWELEDGCDPRWSQELKVRVGELAPFPLGDEHAYQALIETLESLSFVARVEDFAPDPELGCDIELVLREPVACIPSNGLFYAVDAEGVLLSGSWERPLYCGGVPLPVLGPMSDGDGLFSQARPGDWLVEEEHLDALRVALSMGECLSTDARDAMGRLVIDATQSRFASVSNPGIELLLGGRRLILFGRAVDSAEPGELPVERKWASLESCLLGERASALEGWGLLDLRWDHPEVDLQPLLLAQAESSPPSTRVTRSADRLPVDSGPRASIGASAHTGSRVR